MASSDPWVGVYDRIPAPMPRMAPPPPEPPVEAVNIVHEVGSPPRVVGWRLGLAAVFFWLARRLAGLQ